MIMRIRRLLLCFASLALFAPLALAASPAAAPLPDNSVYRVPALTLRDQQGDVFSFASLRGEPRLVSMFYGSCKMVCPLLIENIRRIEQAVAARGAAPLP
ncbi:SCO1/SenC family protein, partial [mine drainage metagenome]